MVRALDWGSSEWTENAAVNRFEPAYLARCSNYIGQLKVITYFEQCFSIVSKGWNNELDRQVRT